MKLILFFPFLLIFSGASRAQTKAEDSVFVVTHYQKTEQMITMRDGIKLYTAIYSPKDTLQKHPVLIKRTPYGCAPYGKDFVKTWNSYHMKYCRANYILVYQDVRGRYMSEGFFEDVRPFNPNKSGDDTDEASDTYDTIEWLVKNVKGNNGNAGVFGISYPGFYSIMAALSGHPALKAVSPQAPVTDWFEGDDFHHNGALMLMDAFSFYSSFGVPRPQPTTIYNKGFAISQLDKYKFYLEAGPLSNLNKRYLGDSIRFWNDLMNNPTYNEFWQRRNVRRYVSGIKPATLIVGGLFDAEDLFGAWNLYKAVELANPPDHYNIVVMGPWFHGTWEGRSTGEFLGDIRFGSKTSKYYQDSIEFPFFQHLLNHKPPAKLAEATVFFTGQNNWHRLNQWPPASTVKKPLFFQAGKKLSFTKPKKPGDHDNPDNSKAYSEYISDPAKPVPFEGADTIKTRTKEYMTGDQRFAGNRKDVLTLQTDILTAPITLAGPVVADLMVSTSTTDADFVIKLIDKFPANVSTKGRDSDTLYAGNLKMNGYQMLVRGEIMRGKFRNSLEVPEPFVPNKITKVSFTLPDVAHTFLKGHRIMVQVQSSWFPLADRNPQTFTDIYKATEADFKKATIRLFHTNGLSSKLILPVYTATPE